MHLFKIYPFKNVVFRLKRSSFLKGVEILIKELKVPLNKEVLDLPSPSSPLVTCFLHRLSIDGLKAERRKSTIRTVAFQLLHNGMCAPSQWQLDSSTLLIHPTAALTGHSDMKLC